MKEHELNSASLDGFLLGIRIVLQAHDIHIPGTEDHKHWDLLREVAEGRNTLVNSPSEKTFKYPKMTTKMKDYLKRNTSRLIQKDQDLARCILNAMK